MNTAKEHAPLREQRGVSDASTRNTSASYHVSEFLQEPSDCRQPLVRA